MSVPQQLFTCPDCEGSGVEVYGITVYEHGCGFSHDSSDERPCDECAGLGFYVDDAEPDEEREKVCRHPRCACRVGKCELLY